MGVIALKPRRMWCTLMTTKMVIIHNKEDNRGINNTLSIKEVTKVILSIPINLP
jgi:hypothetical protein